MRVQAAKFEFSRDFYHAALHALTFTRPYPGHYGRQGCMTKARENSNFIKILVHTFVRPHRSASDLTLSILYVVKSTMKLNY